MCDGRAMTCHGRMTESEESRPDCVRQIKRQLSACCPQALKMASESVPEPRKESRIARRATIKPWVTAQRWPRGKYAIKAPLKEATRGRGEYCCHSGLFQRQCYLLMASPGPTLRVVPGLSRYSPSGILNRCFVVLRLLHWGQHIYIITQFFRGRCDFI